MAGDAHDEVPRGRRERRALATRTALVDAAMELFEERGYSATSIDDITDRADVARRTFFRYFASKESVLLPEASDYDAAFARAITDERLPVDMHAVARAFTKVAEQMQRDDGFHRRERIIRDNREQFRSFTLLRIEHGRQLIAEHVAAHAGCAPDDRALLMAADLVLLAFSHAFVDWFDSDRRRSLVEVVEEAFELMLAVASGGCTFGGSIDAVGDVITRRAESSGRGRR